MVVTLSDGAAGQMRELTATTAAEAAQIAAGEGSVLGDDVWHRECAAGSLSAAAWKARDGNKPNPKPLPLPLTLPLPLALSRERQR